MNINHISKLQYIYIHISNSIQEIEPLYWPNTKGKVTGCTYVYHVNILFSLRICFLLSYQFQILLRNNIFDGENIKTYL